MRSNISLTFRVETQNARLSWLLNEFRLVVNKSIRTANSQGIRSRARLSAVAYAELGREHPILKQYIPSALGMALSLLKAHRRSLRRGKVSSLPFVRRPLLRVVNQAYRLDRSTGRIRIPVRAHEYVELDLPISRWHRTFLDDPSWTIGSLTVAPGKIVICVRKQPVPTYIPETALALDTNENSLDGVAAGCQETKLVTLSLGGIRRIQAVHFVRRRMLARKKKGDRRVKRVLLAREGSRERNRVRQRLNLVSKRLVVAAKSAKSAIIIENLTLHGAGGSSRRMNRRLSSWPRREIHRQIEYKAALAGVPVVKVNPQWTSKTCPVCGARRRDRVGKVFVCLMCDWEMDRQINAGLNILKTALASNEALARAVRFQPGALRHDVVSPLYDLLREGGGAREEPSGVELSGVV